ncbi:uncharacterized protein SRS1_13378 [Sporisorium reilianum f. sp. reilianum]|uniref:Uncharacterized protein n=1 Tax=Sporisorium reilianum f. sp. reilianum TaxID=72559 RepID=A0A2N8UBZ0_9BASI|nr:uncharacterized protein SRS1_13378 [Sporisorium reilianum f. sp. reilianum]
MDSWYQQSWDGHVQNGAPQGWSSDTSHSWNPSSLYPSQGQPSHYPFATQSSAHGTHSSASRPHNDDSDFMINLLDEAEPKDAVQGSDVPATSGSSESTTAPHVPAAGSRRPREGPVMEALSRKDLTNSWPFRRNSRVLPIYGLKSPDRTEVLIHMTNHGNNPKRLRTADGATVLDRFHYRFFGVPRMLEEGKKPQVVLYMAAAAFEPGHLLEIDWELAKFLEHSKAARVQV